MDPDGGNRRSLSGPLPARVLGQGISGLEPVAWSNGTLLAGLINEFGSPPYAVDPQTKTLRQIGRFGFRGVAEGLSHDGRHVLVEGTPDEVFASHEFRAAITGASVGHHPELAE